MFQVIRLRLALLAVLLLLTAGLSYGISNRAASVAQRQPQLQETFAQVSGWSGFSSVPLSESIVNELMLDDYLFRNYIRGREPINLYVGYYNSARKVGSAHDPLVCFQGQGWRIASREKGHHQLAGDPERQIAYAALVVERERHQELVIYWFQADGTTSDNTFRQKLSMVWQRLSGGSENNAFVRINSPIGDESPELVKQRIFDFIDAFYPRFHAYITRG